MKYGNCLLGLIIIWNNISDKGRIVIKKSDHGWMPHFLFRTNKGIYHHYRLEKDVFPFPFCYLIFKGQFHTYPTKRSLSYAS